MVELTDIHAMLDANFIEKASDFNQEEESTPSRTKNIYLNDYISWFNESRIRSLKVSQSGMCLDLDTTVLRSRIPIQRLALHLDPMLSQQTLLKTGLLGSFPNLRRLEVLCRITDFRTMHSSVAKGSKTLILNHRGIHDAVGTILEALRSGSSPHLQELIVNGKLYFIGTYSLGI
jgi:hypothetical protein